MLKVNAPLEILQQRAYKLANGVFIDDAGLDGLPEVANLLTRREEAVGAAGPEMTPARA